MNYGDIYRHYKGGKYIFNCIAFPLKDTHIIEVDKSSSVEIATHTETLEEIRLFDIMGVAIADSDEYLVIYQSLNDSTKYWARPVNMFFDTWLSIEGQEWQLIKRFELMKNTL